jgi:hypothetical protein
MGVTRRPPEALVKMSRTPADEPVLITAAEPSLAEQHEARRRKYVLMMSIRVVCLIVAAAVHQIIWLMALFAIAAVVLPWMAVLVANDRPAKRGMSIPFFHARRPQARQLAPTDQPQLPPAPRDAQVIDAEE